MSQKLSHYLKFFTALLICLLAGMEVDIFVPSFPELTHVFKLSPVMVQLTLSLNFIAYCICSLFAGTLGDKYGRRPAMLGSLFLFVIGSLLCVFAQSFPFLLVGRILQGVGIAGPASLGYLIIADEYPIEKQASMLGILNGMITCGMAFAPVIGSYVNFYYNWRANFVVLLGIGFLCLIFAFLIVPKKGGDASVSFSLRAYKSLVKSEKMRAFVWVICFLVLPYWIFIALSPLFYMEGMGVDLKSFGFYQGAMAAVFAIVSLISPKLFQLFGQERCFMAGVFLCGTNFVLLFCLALGGAHNPTLITGVMLLLSIGVIFPINILYPLALEVLGGSAKARAAAAIVFTRLLLTAFFIEFVSYFYKGTFLPIGVTMAVILGCGLFYIYKIQKKNWVTFPKRKNESLERKTRKAS